MCRLAITKTLGTVQASILRYLQQNEDLSALKIKVSQERTPLEQSLCRDGFTKNMGIASAGVEFPLCRGYREYTSSDKRDSRKWCFSVLYHSPVVAKHRCQVAWSTITLSARGIYTWGTLARWQAMQRSREGRFVLIGIVTLDTQDIPTSLFDHRAMSSPSMSLKAYGLS